MSKQLPDELARSASIHDREYAWSPAEVPDVLRKAQQLGYACIGGQFQFRWNQTTCEMYWLSSDAADREPNETWAEFSARSCSEVLAGFKKLLSTVDFRKEAQTWPALKQAMYGLDPLSALVFVAYFESEPA